MMHQDPVADEELDNGNDGPNHSLWLAVAAGLESALSTAILFGPLARVWDAAALIAGLIVLPFTSIVVVVLLATAEIGFRKRAVLEFTLWVLATAIVQVVVLIRIVLSVVR